MFNTTKLAKYLYPCTKQFNSIHKPLLTVSPFTWKTPNVHAPQAQNAPQLACSATTQSSPLNYPEEQAGFVYGKHL